ncbi:MAG: type II toxin-antitoxin system VapC family toxin [Thiohalomonadales bacterium]
MILVDSSVWIDHLRQCDDILVHQLNNNNVLMHPFILGELACGNVKNRNQILELFNNLPKSVVATDSEVLYFIEQYNLMGTGIGYIDSHLLSAVALTNSAQFWTRDKRLKAISDSLSYSCGLN